MVLTPLMPLGQIGLESAVSATQPGIQPLTKNIQHLQKRMSGLNEAMVSQAFYAKMLTLPDETQWVLNARNDNISTGRKFG